MVTTPMTARTKMPLRYGFEHEKVWKMDKPDDPVTVSQLPRDVRHSDDDNDDDDDDDGDDDDDDDGSNAAT